jgi:Ca2+-binding EF-hand superfamily protein
MRPFPVALRPDAAFTGDRHMQRFLPIAGLLLLAPLSLLAQDAGQHRAAVDANHDGVIERSEAAANPRMARAFERLDRNHDGRLTADERPMHRGGMHAGKRGHGGIERFDADHDGRISRAEFDAGRARREARMQRRPAREGQWQRKPLDFAAIDANRDGFIVRGELRAYHERMRPQREAERKARFDARFREADLNRDGKLGRAEVQEKMPRLAERFAWMDENHDGFLSRAELQPPHGR